MDTTLRLVSSLASLAAVALCVEHFWAKLTAMARSAVRLVVGFARALWAGWARTHPYMRFGIAGGLLTLGLRVVVVVHYQMTAWQPASPADVATSLGAPLIPAAVSLALWPALMFAAEVPWSARLVVASLAAMVAAMWAIVGPGTFLGDATFADGVRAPFVVSVGGGSIALVLSMAVFAAVVITAGLLPRWSPRSAGPVQLDLPLRPSSHR